MPMPPETLEKYIKDAFPDARVEIRDLVGDQDHYEATIVSKAFTGKPRPQQHKMVYEALKGHMGTTLHALSLKTSAG